MTLTLGKFFKKKQQVNTVPTQFINNIFYRGQTLAQIDQALLNRNEGDLVKFVVLNIPYDNAFRFNPGAQVKMKIHKLYRFQSI